MSEESLVVVCPNPKCRKEIEEPILLNILSFDPPKQYKACPYCFSKLEFEEEPKQEEPIEVTEVPEPSIEQEEETMDVEEEDETEDTLSSDGVIEKFKDSAPGFLQKVKDLLPTSNGDKKETKEKIKEVEAEPEVEKETEIVPEEETEDEPLDMMDEPEELTEHESPEEEAEKEESETEEFPKEESEALGCPETFGYLANRPTDAPIPPQCLLCAKIVECMLQPKK